MNTESFFKNINGSIKFIWLLVTPVPILQAKVLKNTKTSSCNALTCLMITLPLPVSHVTVSVWQHMALLCNSADKEWSDLSRSQMKCDLLWAGCSLTHTCWFALLMGLYAKSSRCRMLESPFCVLLPPPPTPRPFFLPSTLCCMLYMWHWSRFRNPVQMFSILVQSLLCF